jgi:predicted nucleic acid-binding protein
VRILLDSSVWISYFNQSDVHHNEAENIITAALQRNANIVVPDLVYIEVLNNVWRLTKRHSTLKQCRTVFQESAPYIELVMGNRPFWFEYVEQELTTISLRTADLIIAAYGKYFEVDRFETFDKNLKKQVDKLLAT